MEEIDETLIVDEISDANRAWLDWMTTDDGVKCLIYAGSKKHRSRVYLAFMAGFNYGQAHHP